MNKNNNVRYLALKAVLKMESNCFSQVILDDFIQEYKLNKQDSKFFTYLVYGVLERRITLDYTIAQLVAPKFHKLSLEVLNILRLGTYQIIYMNSVPDSAAVNESVTLAYKVKQTSAKGLINAVLRKITQLEGGLLLPPLQDIGLYYSVKYSISPDIIALFLSQYGPEKTEKICVGFEEIPPVSLRVNTTKITPKELLEQLQEKEFDVTANENLPENLWLKQMGDIQRIYAFQRGYFHVQDTASQLALSCLPLKKGQVVLDVCAAPGGKSFTMAEMMENQGQIIAVDKSQGKIDKIQSMADRLGLTCITPRIGDSTQPQPVPMADLVLCDVPCSGIGILKKKPELRYKQQGDWESLYQIQRDILNNSSEKVKVGGVLVYTTCTLNHKENLDVIEEFLASHKEFRPKTFSLQYKALQEKETYFITMLPDETGCDGFFMAMLERI